MTDIAHKQKTLPFRNGSFRVVRSVGATFALGLGLAACGGSLPSMNDLTGNMFKEKEEILVGERVAVLKSRSALAPSKDAAKYSVSIPTQQSNDSWSQPGGNRGNAPGHLSFAGSMHTRWTSSAGEGTTSDGQLTSRPVMYGGRVYTLDTEGLVSSFSASGGSAGWRVRLTPENEEKDEGYGGGLAIDNGRLFAATGYGTVVALDPKSGKSLWTKSLGVPVRTSPTAGGEKLFVVTTEGRLYCLSATDGEELWTQRGLPDRTSILSNTSPAVTGNTVVVTYSSGEIAAYDIKDGRVLWTDSLATTKRGSSLASMASPGRPVIANGVVYAAGNSGRMIATSSKDGARLWSKTLSSNETPWVAGNIVYVVDKQARVVALTAKGGEVVWVKQLSQSEHWRGPIMAGGRIWVASDKGRMAGLNPKNGELVTQKEIGHRIHIAPIVAAGHMYILTDNAKLLALN